MSTVILLIVALLSDDELKSFQNLATQLDLDCLVEVHTEGELSRALKSQAEIIGINNRDLSTFHVDLSVAESLIQRLPQSVVKVAESGIQNGEDALRMKRAGFDAILVGEALMCSLHPGKVIEELAL